ncbi:Protocadherin gamma-C4 [Camelus dromedarius]|uniref:Protocadherin gamma-C3 n=1 Tax=Camelus dromedarius TaxID=9838 RepID=A0A5N4EDY7_CAMDR|nr:Protocadherin gamma-C4 [Camelus dromedarius]
MVPEAWRGGLVSTGRVVGVLLLLGALHKASAAVIRYEILEEREKGFVVGNVVRDLGLDLGSLSARKLRVLSRASRRFFEVNRETGEMFVNDRLDREELCGTLPSCTVTLELVMERPLELFSAEVVIQDINDNNPSFPTREMKLEISEAVAPGTRFPLESAHDPDVGSNSLQTYELSRNEYFALRVQTREDSTKYAELVLERALDQEREASLQLVLTALDGGTPARSASLPIRIIVLDANDNAPTFNQSLYRARVLEDAPPGTRVVQVRATDLDEGPNGEIIYSFGSHNRAGVRELFSLDLVTGVLTVKGRLDFEDTKLHEIYIQAKDKGANPEGAHCKVLVEVVDVNDNAPEITVTSVYSPVPEDAPLGTVIALLSVSDLDSGENGLVTCEVPPGLPFSLTSSLKNYFTLKTSSALDRETVPEYNLSITARDAGTPSLSALTTVRVQVSDINDNPPQSSQSSYDVYVEENNLPGVPILNLSVWDPDAPQNARLSFFLLEQGAEIGLVGRYFTINRDSGVVSSLVPLDYEDRREFELTAHISDGGTPVLATNISLNIFVTDRNDNAPQVIYPRPGQSSVEILPRGAATGHVVTRVVGWDPDAGHNAWLSYSLLGAPNQSLFAVGLHTGQVSTARPVQDTDSPRQTLTVLIKDNGEPSLSTTATLTVSVTEESPEARAEFPSSSAPGEQNKNLTFYLLLSLILVSVGSLYRTPGPSLHADAVRGGLMPPHLYHQVYLTTDSRRSDPLLKKPAARTRCEAAIRYSIGKCWVQRAPLRDRAHAVAVFPTEKGRGGGEGAAVYQSGGGRQTNLPRHQQKTARNPCGAGPAAPELARGKGDRCLQLLWPFWGGSAYSASQDQIVRSWVEICRGATLLFLFCHLGYVCGQIRYPVPEESQEGTFVGNVAQDFLLDTESLSARRLQVAGEVNQRHFRVDLDSGALLIKNPIDREALCGLSASCIVPLEFVTEGPLEMYRAEVEIVDVNDHAPRFPRQQLDLEIGEAAPPGQRFPLEKAQDADVGSNSISSYRLSSNEHFALDVKKRSDGSLVPELLLEKPLDREKQSDYRLVLTAVDGGNPPRSGTAELRVSVLDVNDNAPAFQQSSYRISVLESAPAGMLLIQLNASDPDLGPSGNVTFSFSGHTPDRVRNLFSLHPTTGKLTLQGPLDFESENYYEFDVRARDGGSPAMEQHCSLRVDLLDVNDNAPHITVTSELGTLPESAEPGTVVALISVQDPDSGSNGDVSLRIPDHLPFALKSAFRNQFSLVTAGPLDREAKSSYDIMVTASDAGNPPLSTHRTIFLNISDVNDNPPSFFQRSHEVFVPENNRPGDLLCSLAASDPDSGLNALISYSLLEPRNRDVSASSFISLNPQTGAVHATRSFDYEQTQTLQFEVQARDRGNPPLSSTVTVRLFVLDLNDNAPAVLRPRARPGSLCPQALPPSVGAGHLVTKVTAVDLDSGYNAWVSYQLLEAPDPSLFAVSRYAGEVRTAVPIPADLPPQKLVIVVKDSGSPPLSTSVTLLVSLEEDTHPVVPDLRESSAPREGESRLTLYLAVSLVAICFVSFGSFVALISKCLRGAACGVTCFPAGTCACLTRSRRREGLPPSNGILRIQLGSDDPIKFVDVGGHSHGCTPLASAPTRSDSFMMVKSPSAPMAGEPVRPSCPPSDLLYGLEVRPLQAQPMLEGYSDADVWLGHVPETPQLHSDSIPLPPHPRHLVTKKNCCGQTNLGAVFKRLEGDIRDFSCYIPSPGQCPGMDFWVMGPKTAPQLAGKWQVLCMLSLCCWGWVSGQLRYSVVEESEPGTLVGNVAQDLGLKVTDLLSRRLRLGSEENGHYFSLSLRSGALAVNQKIDRERLCGASTSCLLPVQVVTEHPLELIRVEVEILDLNDNSPSFATPEREIRISESAALGARFPLDSAQDPDVGTNTVSFYTLSPSSHFSLNVKTLKDGKLFPELVLEQQLDREAQARHQLVLTAVDGGVPARSGTTLISVTVLDINDNAPAFQSSVLRVALPENTPMGTLLLRLNATDPDEGTNGQLDYSFGDHTSEAVRNLFGLDPSSGAIHVLGPIDFEESSFYEIHARARDQGQPAMEGHCVIQVDVGDANDNAPAVLLASLVNPVLESTPVGTVVGLFNVRDRDSGRNGEVSLDISPDLPFQIKPSENHYSLLTSQPLDREATSHYIIELQAHDAGSPPLHAHLTIRLNISDVNDNAPYFTQQLYTAYIPENRPPGSLLCTVAASDPDTGDNARLTYSIVGNQIQGAPASSFVYVNPEDGRVFAQRTFDYELLQMLQIMVGVRDSGSPPLHANTSLHVFVLDQNDNAPAVLHPRPGRELSIPQRLPRSAPPGSLVTKVTAVDADAGHNAWLSYSLLPQSTAPGLFLVSAHTGEVRTARALLEDDADTQQVVVLVRDNGDPSLSSTATVLLILEDEDPEEMPKSRDFLIHPPERSDLTLYLIVALAAISLLSLVTFTFLSAKCLRGRGGGGGGPCCMRRDSPSREFYAQSSPNLQVSSDGTLKYMEVTLRPTDSHSHCYRTCFSPASDGSDFTFLRPLSIQQPSALAPEPDAFRSRSNTLLERSQVRGSASRPSTSGPLNLQPPLCCGLYPNVGTVWTDCAIPEVSEPREVTVTVGLGVRIRPTLPPHARKGWGRAIISATSAGVGVRVPVEVHTCSWPTPWVFRTHSRAAHSARAPHASPARAHARRTWPSTHAAFTASPLTASLPRRCRPQRSSLLTPGRRHPRWSPPQGPKRSSSHPRPEMPQGWLEPTAGSMGAALGAGGTLLRAPCRRRRHLQPRSLAGAGRTPLWPAARRGPAWDLSSTTILLECKGSGRSEIGFWLRRNHNVPRDLGSGL